MKIQRQQQAKVSGLFSPQIPPMPSAEKTHQISGFENDIFSNRAKSTAYGYLQGIRRLGITSGGELQGAGPTVVRTQSPIPIPADYHSPQIYISYRFIPFPIHFPILKTSACYRYAWHPWIGLMYSFQQFSFLLVTGKLTETPLKRRERTSVSCKLPD